MGNPPYLTMAVANKRILKVPTFEPARRDPQVRIWKPYNTCTETAGSHCIIVVLTQRQCGTKPIQCRVQP